METEFWPMFEPVITPLLCGEDDTALWSAVVNTIYTDAYALCRSVTGRGRVLTQLGRCSHWLRPHQTRWPEGGGFAWPTGYDGHRFSRSGLPEFDWFRLWEWLPDSGGWEAVNGAPQPGHLLFRVAVPSRSRRHRQAAVHSVWQPGPPPRPQVQLSQFYGFREQEGWLCTAYRGTGDWVYELAAVDQDTQSSAKVIREVSDER